MLRASSIMLISARDQPSQILLMLCFTACTEERAKYAQGRLITLCLGDSVLWPAGYCYFQLFAVLGLLMLPVQIFSFLLPIGDRSDKRLKWEKLFKRAVGLARVAAFKGISSL